MQWVYSSCYACSLVVYLAVKLYYENEVKKCSHVDGDRCGCLDCSAEQRPSKGLTSASSTTRPLLLLSPRRPSLRLPTHQLHVQDKRHVCTRPQRSRGQS